jgi:hypothetical protein
MERPPMTPMPDMRDLRHVVLYTITEVRVLAQRRTRRTTGRPRMRSLRVRRWSRAAAVV